MSCNEKLTKSSAHKQCCNEQKAHADYKRHPLGTGFMGAGYGHKMAQSSSHSCSSGYYGEQRMPWREMYLALLQQHAKALGDVATQFSTLNRAYEERIQEHDDETCRIAEQGYEEAYKMVVGLNEKIDNLKAENKILREQLVACGCTPHDEDPTDCCKGNEKDVPEDLPDDYFVGLKDPETCCKMR